MRTLSPSLIGGIAVAMLAAVALLAWAAGRAEGRMVDVRIAGVEVGGRTPPAAVAAVARRLGPLDERPVRVRAAGTTFTLTAERARVRRDLRATVARVYAAGHRGSFLERGWRHLTSRRILHGDDIIMSVDRGAIDRFTRHIDRTLAKRGGLRLKDLTALRREIDVAFRSVRASRWIVAPSTRAPAA